MSFETILPLIITLSGVVISAVVYIYKGIMQRIDRLEQDTADHLTAPEVRLLISDKIEPLHEDVRELKVSVERMLDHIIALKK